MRLSNFLKRTWYYIKRFKRWYDKHHRKQKRKSQRKNSPQPPWVTNKQTVYYLYQLKLKGGITYVGITNNPQRRINQHASGKGAKITKIYKPIKTVGVRKLGYMTFNQAEQYENEATLALMEKRGYKKVRGGAWCMVDPKQVRRNLILQQNNIANYYHHDVRRMIR